MTKPVSLVTGVSRGIGLAAVHRLARDGHEVIGLSRSAPPPGTPCTFVAVDLANAAATDAALKEITQRRTISNLVNNAGVPVPDRAGEVTLEGYEQVMAVNVRASLQAMQACLPGMQRQRYGRIVNISSRAALGKAERSAYAIAKAGIIGLTRTWALEVGKDGINVNAIAPGGVVTELFEQNNTKEYVEKFAASTPLKRLGTPDDIAGVIAFLLGPDASYITGQTLFVCGGMSVTSSMI
jgi:3-oxoacyl-[acyl-carrier protein] reductase